MGNSRINCKVGITDQWQLCRIIEENIETILQVWLQTIQ